MEILYYLVLNNINNKLKTFLARTEMSGFFYETLGAS